jgi:hypothetical protein
MTPNAKSIPEPTLCVPPDHEAQRAADDLRVRSHRIVDGELPPLAPAGRSPRLMNSRTTGPGAPAAEQRRRIHSGEYDGSDVLRETARRLLTSGDL